MKIDDNLSKVFDVEPSDVKEIVTTADGEIIPDTGNKIDVDYETTRKNLHILLVQGQSALQSALDVAQSSEHPRAFEVVGNLMKQLADVNQQLLDLHRQKQKLDEPTTKDDPKKITNNAIFVGSTAELNKLIKNMTKGD
jgi:hypothetical protein